VGMCVAAETQRRYASTPRACDTSPDRRGELSVDSGDVSASLGKIMGNLHSLEFVMRLFLHEAQRAPGIQTASGFEETVGQWVPENSITNYDTLGQVIAKINSELQARGSTDRIEESMIELRDALAHGRILANWPPGPFRLVKFSKPRDAKVQVVFSVTMTPEWLAEQVRRTHAEILKVVEAGRALGFDCFPDP